MITWGPTTHLRFAAHDARPIDLHRAERRADRTLVVAVERAVVAGFWVWRAGVLGRGWATDVARHIWRRA